MEYNKKLNIEKCIQLKIMSSKQNHDTPLAQLSMAENKEMPWYKVQTLDAIWRKLVLYYHVY